MLREILPLWFDTFWELLKSTVQYRVTMTCPFVPSDAIAVRQSQVDKLYAGLKDLAGERRGKLEEVFKLYTLHREIDDLLQWIAEKSIVAGSNDPGQDYEHVSVSGITLVLCLFAYFSCAVSCIGCVRVWVSGEVDSDHLLEDMCTVYSGGLDC